MTSRLRTAFIDNLKSADWMDYDTKQSAKEKVKRGESIQIHRPLVNHIYFSNVFIQPGIEGTTMQALSSSTLSFLKRKTDRIPRQNNPLSKAWFFLRHKQRHKHKDNGSTQDTHSICIST